MSYSSFQPAEASPPNIIKTNTRRSFGACAGKDGKGCGKNDEFPLEHAGLGARSNNSREYATGSAELCHQKISNISVYTYFIWSYPGCFMVQRSGLIQYHHFELVYAKARSFHSLQPSTTFQIHLSRGSTWTYMVGTWAPKPQCISMC